MNYPLKNIAITLSPKPQHALKPLQQYDLYTPNLWGILRKFSEYYARPELTLSGLIHYHVFLQIQTKEEFITWQRSSLPALKKMGNTKVKPITEGTEDQWIAYIDKESAEYDKIFVNRQCNLCSANAPTTKEIKKLMKDGVAESLDEGIKKILTQYKLKLNDTLEDI